jgi:tRNA(Ile)-lysidine synthase
MASLKKSHSPRSASSGDSGDDRAARPRSGSAALEEHVGPILDARVPRGSSLTVGLSGGLDSVVLLDLVARWAQRTAGVTPRADVRALHVHHGLSPNADSWAAFCALVARRRAVPIRVTGVRVELSGRGLEAAARTARYAEYAKVETPFLLLAHHQDDQAETVLLQLVRGAGLEGLSAMPVARTLREGAAPGPVVLRPLLAVSRSAIRRYARARRLRWIEDESNDDLRFARNFVRHRVMPELEALAPGVAERLARSAAHLAQAAEIVSERAAEDARDVRARDGSIAYLQTLGVARAMHALRELLRAAGAATPTAAQLEQLWAQLTGARRDARVEVRLSDATVRRYRDRIVVDIHRVRAPTAAAPTTSAPPAGPDMTAIWDGTEPWAISAGCSRLSQVLRAKASIRRFSRYLR